MSAIEISYERSGVVDGQEGGSSMSERKSQGQEPRDVTGGSLAQRLEAAEHARDEAEASVTAKASLLATVSHEIRTPIGAIISMTDLLLGTALDQTQRNYADTLRQSANGLLTILNDILDHSKLEAGQFDLSPDRFDPRAMLSAVEAAMKARAAGKSVEIAAEVDEDVSPMLVGDVHRIRQILLNIADNAVKFTEEGSVRLSMSQDAIDGSTVSLRFAIGDTGIGISDDMLARLFVPYSQGRQTTTTKYGGTGLGLSIARRLVELMGGTIECERIPGTGTVFRFSVRCTEWNSAEQSAPAPRAKPARASRDMQHHAHILVVEDNKINQMLITTYLEKFGHSFDIASNGFEAVEAAAKGGYDVILMDVQMPEMDGIEATRRIRALGAGAGSQPIVALTANAMHGDRESYLAAGMNDYLAKPITAANLFETLSRVLDGTRKGAGKKSA
jgi:signal transduction histidine kinase/CheY-like chemotaxis protein